MSCQEKSRLLDAIYEIEHATAIVEGCRQALFFSPSPQGCTPSTRNANAGVWNQSCLYIHNFLQGLTWGGKSMGATYLEELKVDNEQFSFRQEGVHLRLQALRRQTASIYQGNRARLFHYSIAWAYGVMIGRQSTGAGVKPGHVALVEDIACHSHPSASCSTLVPETRTTETLAAVPARHFNVYLSAACSDGCWGLNKAPTARAGKQTRDDIENYFR